MKKSILSLLILAIVSFAFTTQGQKKKTTLKEKEISINWQSDYDEAFKLAQKKKKPLLVFFTGSDWCGPCKMLHADLFDNEEFIKYANKNLILYKADFPRKESNITDAQKLKNNELKSKFNIAGFPTVILLNSKGEILGKQVGYSRTQGSENHKKTIEDAIKNYK